MDHFVFLMQQCDGALISRGQHMDNRIYSFPIVKNTSAQKLAIMYLSTRRIDSNRALWNSGKVSKWARKQHLNARAQAMT